MCNQTLNYPDDVKPQHQTKQPGEETQMNPQPIFDNPNYKGTGRLKDKAAIITGGDSGIGKAVALAYAKEGANIVIVYLNEHKDAEDTKRLIEGSGVKCQLISGNVGDASFCKQVVDMTIKNFGRIDILVNNAAEQHPQKCLADISDQQLQGTFATNIFSVFYLTREALPHLKENSVIINTSSITAFAGDKELIDYSATKGAITAFTRSLALSLADKNIRVNCVAPGPTWTPLIPSSFDAQKVGQFGENTPLKRPAQPAELAEAYLFLAADGATYITGQTIHVNGGRIVNC